MKRSQQAQALRRMQTAHEQRLWKQLRANRFAGLHFRRQHPIGPYIVDFACLTRRLVIELDGGQHAEQVAYDGKRTALLNKLGYRVLRFWNRDVDENLSGVLMVIGEELYK